MKQAFILSFILILSFCRSLACGTKASDRTKWISLNNEACLARPALIDFNSYKLYYYSFIVSVDRCNRSCDTPSGKIFLLNKREYANLNVLNMISEINELTKHISFDCKCKLDGREFNSN